ncbi:MAG: AAA family ATPase [Spirochaetaceae bacterium]|nr:AAA family ATPase [Spirochaetaceae bacterium]
MSNSLDRLTIKGFKSIKELVDFQLTNLNVVIGGNGSGKSNLISFFRMLRALMENNLNRYVRDNGGAGDILFNGRKVTSKMEFETMFGPRGYKFNLVPTPSNDCAIEDEARFYKHGTTGWWQLGDNSEGKAKLVEEIEKKKSDAEYSRLVYDAIKSWQIYHFHDTSSTAAMRNYESVEDNRYLRPDAANIAPFLLKLKDSQEKVYDGILDAVRLATPFFDDFILEPRKSGNKTEVNLSWTQKGSDYPMQPYHLSDGSIRFICLATALLQPYPPACIIIDEPELGLHPAAIAVLAELIQVAAKETQVIIATQSPLLVDHFSIEDIIVVNREQGASIFSRLDKNQFDTWLEDYSIGELWTKNVIAGGPSYE